MTGPGFAVLLRTPTGEQLEHYEGQANLEHEAPITANTRFNVGSVAKQVTAHLALLSAQRGLLYLDQPAQRWLPKLKIADVTIADLIQHHGGIRDTESLLSLAGLRDLDHYTADDLLELAYRQEQRAVPPGTFLYSNTGYLMLTEILQTAHDEPLQEIARRLLFDPLGMPTAVFRHSVNDVIPNAATAYSATPNGWTSLTRPVTLPGPGSLWISPHDLARWLDHLREVDLPNEPLPEMPSDRPPWTYGPGLYVIRDHVFHHGHEHGFSAATHTSKNGLSLIILTNNADIDAGSLGTLLFKRPTDQAAPEDLFQEIISTATAPRQPTASAPPVQNTADHEELGCYHCPDVPGQLRLTRHSTDLYLWRHGTADRLVPHQHGWKGPGYTITNIKDASVAAFTLNLTRAPGLSYIRIDRRREIR